MKSIVCACVLFYVSSIGNAQFGNFFGGRQQQQQQQPFYGGWGFQGIDPFMAALFFGFDYNELMALQQMNNNQGRGVRPGVQQQAMREIQTLSALGLIDGPDAPDNRRRGTGPAAGGKRPAGRRRGAAGGGERENRPRPRPRAPAKKAAGKKKQGPRRRRPNRRGGA